MLLPDTHALFWTLLDADQLSSNARQALEDRRNSVHVSVASAWEIAIKVGSGKWPEARSLLEDFEGLMLAEQFRMLPIEVHHVRSAGLLNASHRDPFDRLLASQAIAEGLTILTADPKLRQLGAPCLW